MTRILQGAPGAGKSSILHELRERAVQAARKPSGNGVPVPRILVLNSGSILGPEDILGPLSGIVLPGRDIGREARERVRVAASRLFGLEVDGAAGSKPDPEMQKWSVFRQWVGTWSQGAGLPAPVVIAIDEAQRLKMDDLHPLSKLLQVVHDGETELPLALVLAGLGNTAARAQGMGLTRGLTIHPIASLSREEGKDEVTELVRGFCKHFGLDPSGQESRLRELAMPCEGWPRHLHLMLQGFGRSALAASGNLDRLDWERVNQEAAESRLSYYLRQTSPEMSRSKHLVASVMRRVSGPDDPGRGIDVVDLLGAIEQSIEDSPGHRLPEGMRAEDFLQHLTHQGALHESVDKSFRCPIPSFRTYLIEAGGLDPDTYPTMPAEDGESSLSM
ncbi:MAG: ATP-binding protein [Boseongicola sp. SB0677_bin_26]|nr:ATP-binding protein [Boseongicola sp. SB0665_bin_10]MYG25481.1 ATP-binding protein [Boseongicola sp. SB0677_bin_26]